MGPTISTVKINALSETGGGDAVDQDKGEGRGDQNDAVRDRRREGQQKLMRCQDGRRVGGPKKCLKCVVQDAGGQQKQRRREGQQKLMRCLRWEEGGEGPKNVLSR